MSFVLSYYYKRVALLRSGPLRFLVFFDKPIHILYNKKEAAFYERLKIRLTDL